MNKPLYIKSLALLAVVITLILLVCLYGRIGVYKKMDGIEMPRPGVISGYDRIVRKYARRYLFDWRLISAQIYAESRFLSQAVSHCGALGLMQIMPGTARWLEAKAKDEVPQLNKASQKLLDTEINIHLGCYYDSLLFSQLRDTETSDDRHKMMFAAYNAGPGNLKKARKRSEFPESWKSVEPNLPVETRKYIPVIYDKYEVYRCWAVLKPY
jgi:soluble lytic murein transglycosylase-like protein